MSTLHNYSSLCGTFLSIYAASDAQSSCSSVFCGVAIPLVSSENGTYYNPLIML